MADNSNSPLEKANRLIQLRNLAKLSRKDMAELAGVSIFTYKGWENGRFGGIPEKRSDILTQALQIEGIKSSTNWLIYGNNEPPQKILHHQISELKEAISEKTKSPQELEPLKIKAELELFGNNYNWQTISLTVPDDAMEPIFIKGDLVAGVKLPSEKFAQAVGHYCIVRTKNNKLLLRQIQKGSNPKVFTLLGLNQDQKQPIVIQDIELIDVAPVIWIRKTIET